MVVQSRGTCTKCSPDFTRAGISRHLASCVPDSKLATLHLVVTSGRYWQHLAGAPDLRLDELDSFLRTFWLECCGHLSEFEIDGTTYSSNDNPWMEAASTK